MSPPAMVDVDSSATMPRSAAAVLFDGDRAGADLSGVEVGEPSADRLLRRHQPRDVELVVADRGPVGGRRGQYVLVAAGRLRGLEAGGFLQRGGRQLQADQP